MLGRTTLREPIGACCDSYCERCCLIFGEEVSPFPLSAKFMCKKSKASLVFCGVIVEKLSPICCKIRFVFRSFCASISYFLRLLSSIRCSLNFKNSCGRRPLLRGAVMITVKRLPQATSITRYYFKPSTFLYKLFVFSN